MNLAEVRAELAAQLDTIAGLRCYAYPPPSITPPAAWIAPESITYDATYGRGSDEMTLAVVVAVGNPTERSVHELMAAYCDGTGARSVKTVIESGVYTAFDAVRVVGAEFDVVTIATTSCLAALFDLQIAGPGST